MSGAGAPHLDLDGSGLRVEILASSWHEGVMAGLLQGASAACEEAGVTFRITRVPGCFELPVVADHLAKGGADAIVALGVIIRGGTPHFEFVADATTRGLTDVARTNGVPVGFGILTCDDEAQALDRSGLPGSSENKGAEAAQAAIATALVLKGLR